MATGLKSGQLEELVNDKPLWLSLEANKHTQNRLSIIKPSPCSQACPAGVNVKAYVSLIASGRFRQALEVIKQRNPLPGICGRVCTHPCESFCNRAQVDAPVAIRDLKRFVADYELEHPETQPAPIPQTRQEKVAIIGSGPAGLTAANDLIRKGYGVTIFEALTEAGGMLVAGIPSFRLPRDIIRHEINAIRKLGVAIKTRTKISGPKAIDRLFERGYDAIFLAVGAHKGKRLGIRGELSCEGVIDAISFLKQVNLSERPRLHGHVAIIGGGNSAIDSARAARRLGCDQVTIYYRRSREEMLASEAEIRAAEKEGVAIEYLVAPIEIMKAAGRLKQVKFRCMILAEPDESGRRKPIPIYGSEFLATADTMIAAISQTPDLNCVPPESGVAQSKWRAIAADEENLATSRYGVFAGGDAVTGPNTVIDAIAAGHLAAQSIERYLNGEPLTPEASPKISHEIEIKPDLKRYKKQLRTEMPEIADSEKTEGFREIELGLSQEAAVKEAQRCLRCGPCRECLICLPECEKLVTMLSSSNAEGIRCRFPFGLEQFDSTTKPLQGLLSRDGRHSLQIELAPTTCFVYREKCRGCGDCVDICDYDAPVLIPKGDGMYVARIREDLCRGCGTCVAVCPSSAIEQRYFSDARIERILGAVDEKVVVLSCPWHKAGHARSRLQAFIADIKLIFNEVPCSGRVSASLVLKAFERHAAGVVVLGCPRNECHFGFGNTHAEKHFRDTRQMLKMLGIPQERFQWFWVKPEHEDKSIEAISLFLHRIRESKELQYI